jgi:hypothetical protein
MHFHLPKPLHGWREFVGEVGIIVIGVLIALGAEQAIDTIHWRHQAAATREALGAEVAVSAADGAERVALEECLRDRLGELLAKLNATNGSWAANPMKLGQARVSARILPIMPLAYRTPTRDWTDDAWQAAKSTGMLNHMTRDETADYSRLYAMIDGLRSFQDQENALAPTLSFLSFDQHLDNVSRVNALMALGQLDALNAQLALNGRLLVEAAKEMHLKFDRAALAKSTQDTFLAQRRLRGTCVKPIRLDF